LSYSNIFDRMTSKVGSKVKTWRFGRAKAKLEQQLARIIETANGHQAKRLPTGSAAYIELYRQANLTIDAFCTEQAVARLSIEQEVPVLRELEALTHPASPVAAGVKMAGAVLAIIVGALLVGCLSGLIVVGYHFLVR
jgi:hypothetical protein